MFFFYDSLYFEIRIRITSEKPNLNVALDSKFNTYRNLRKKKIKRAFLVF